MYYNHHKKTEYWGKGGSQIQKQTTVYIKNKRRILSSVPQKLKMMRESSIPNTYKITQNLQNN